MSKSLPPKPSLEHLRKQAKELLASARTGDMEAVEAVAIYFPPAAPLTLVQAQLVLAREYGFASWTALTDFVTHGGGALEEFVDAALAGHHERADALWSDHRDGLRRHPAAAAVAPDAAALRELLAADPELANRIVGPKGRPLLCYACYTRLGPEADVVNAADALLGAGADPNAYFVDQWGGADFHETPLYGAAGVLNSAALTRLLLRAGADPNEGLGDREPYSGEAVYHACDHPGHNECLRLLFEAGASQPAKDYCILRKLDFEDLDGVKLFLDHGANPNRGKPRTALSHALLRGRSLDMIRLLLDRGADPNMPDADGATPYVLARRHGNRAAADLLVERGAASDLTLYDRLLVAAADGDVREVKALAAAHPEVLTQFSEYGRQRGDGLPLGAAGSILHDLARNGQTEGLAALLDVGFYVGATNPFNETPLHWACVAGRAETAQMLLQRGAPLEVREKNHGADPIGWAIWGSEFWHEPHGNYVGTVTCLLEYGASPGHGATGSPEIRKLLAERSGAPDPGGA